MAKVFFQATNDALNNITSTFNFVHPLQVSLQYTRRKVAEIHAENPNASELYYRSVIDPSQLVHGVPYRNAFINTPWTTQEEQLAWLLLNNLFAVFEGWAQRLYDERFSFRGNYDEITFGKNFQYTGLNRRFSSYYMRGTNKSSVMEDAFFDVYKMKSSLDFAKLDNYLLLYRYFKEARNCYMHHNLKATRKVINAYNRVQSVASVVSLDAEEVPVIIPPILGQPIQLSLRGVIGFSQFVQRILIISDINLIKSKAAEDEFLARKPDNWYRRTLNSDLSRAKGQITRYSGKAGFLKPVWSNDYQQFLIDNQIFSI